MQKALASAAVALAAALALGASAQTLYRWVDAEGRTHYGDKPPKGFKGTVTALENEGERTSVAAQPAQAPAGAPALVPKPARVGPASEDIAAQRRATRTRLEARLTRARDNVEAAKKALSESDAPADDERQVIQQRQAKGGMHGMAARSNCRTEVGKDGRKSQMCPTSVPTPEYHDRIARLEADLKKAEQELADAEQAWRRGVD